MLCCHIVATNALNVATGRIWLDTADLVNVEIDDPALACCTHACHEIPLQDTPNLLCSDKVYKIGGPTSFE